MIPTQDPPTAEHTALRSMTAAMALLGAGVRSELVPLARPWVEERLAVVEPGAGDPPTVMVIDPETGRPRYGATVEGVVGELLSDVRNARILLRR